MGPTSRPRLLIAPRPAPQHPTPPGDQAGVRQNHAALTKPFALSPRGAVRSRPTSNSCCSLSPPSRQHRPPLPFLPVLFSVVLAPEPTFKPPHVHYPPPCRVSLGELTCVLHRPWLCLTLTCFSCTGSLEPELPPLSRRRSTAAAPPLPVRNLPFLFSFTNSRHSATGRQHTAHGHSLVEVAQVRSKNKLKPIL
jgi:hypothetical protein